MVCFVELFRNENGLVEGVQTVRTACIRAFLQQYGIKTVSYINNSLASVNEVADDIMALANEKYVFIIHENCKLINKAIISFMMSNDDVDIYCIDDNQEKILDEVQVIGSNLETDLLKSFSTLENQAIHEKKVLSNISPYTEKIIPKREILKYGIWIGEKEKRNIDVIDEEIKIIWNIYSDFDTNEFKTIRFTGDYISEEQYYNTLTDVLEKASMKGFKYLIKINENLLDLNLNERNVESDIEYEIKIDSNLSKEKVNKLIELLNKGRIKKIAFKAKLAERDNVISELLCKVQEGSGVQLCPIGVINKNNVNTHVYNLIMENTKKYYYTYYRGFLKSKTGLYSGVNIDGYVRHLDINQNSFESMSKDTINEILSINSSIYVRRDDINTVVDDEIIFDIEGIAHNKNQYYRNLINKISCGEAFPCNLIYINDSRLYLNDIAYQDETNLCDVNYKWATEHIDEIKNYSSTSDVLYMIDIQDKEDYDLFLADADKYMRTHKIDGLPLAYGFLQNACRFISQNNCSVDKIPRLKVDENEYMHMCDKYVNSEFKAETMYELTHNCYVHREKLLSRRGCYDCPTQIWCPKCTELPEYISENYCQIMKEKTYVLDYVLMPHYITGLRESVKGFKEMDIKEVYISNEYMFNLIDSEIKSDVEPYFPKFTTCIFNGTQNILWSPVNNRYYKLSREFAYYIELLLKRKSMGYILEDLKTKYNISQEEAIVNIKLMNDILKKSGVLYRDVLLDD